MHREAEASEKMPRPLTPLGFDDIKHATRPGREIASLTPDMGDQADTAQREHRQETKRGPHRFLSGQVHSQLLKCFPGVLLISWEPVTDVVARSVDQSLPSNR